MSEPLVSLSAKSIVDALKDYGIEDINESDISAMLTHIGPGVARALHMSAGSPTAAEGGYTVLCAMCAVWSIAMQRCGATSVDLTSLEGAAIKAAIGRGSN